MNPLVPFLWAAGGVQFSIVAANAALPRMLGLREHLPRLSPILRQMLLVHWLFILLILMIFGALCLLFAPDLAGGSELGRTLSGLMALFWLVRLPLQLFYYDSDFKKRNRLGNAAMIGSSAFLAAVFAVAASGLVR